MRHHFWFFPCLLFSFDSCNTLRWGPASLSTPVSASPTKISCTLMNPLLKYPYFLRLAPRVHLLGGHVRNLLFLPFPAKQVIDRLLMIGSISICNILEGHFYLIGRAQEQIIGVKGFHLETIHPEVGSCSHKFFEDVEHLLHTQANSPKSHSFKVHFQVKVQMLSKNGYLIIFWAFNVF